MKTITIFPPKMEAMGQALDLFGEKRVMQGEWNEPVTVTDLTWDEAAFAQEFFRELGYTVEAQKKTGSQETAQKSVCAPRATVVA